MHLRLPSESMRRVRFSGRNLGQTEVAGSRQRFRPLKRTLLPSATIDQLRDLSFEFGDDRVELGDLDGILALFVFAEKEDVRVVLRAPAVEVLAVLLVDELAD